MTYLRIYRSAIAAAIITILVLVALPTALTSIAALLPRGPGSFVMAHSSMVKVGLQVFVFVVGALITWVLVRAQEDVIVEGAMNSDEIDIYRQIRDRGIAPTLAGQVVATNTELDEDARTHDWQQANQPSFAAELGYRLGIDGETRQMMREFFTNTEKESNMRRTFSTSLEVTLENGTLHKSNSTDAVVEPVSRFAPRDPDSDPHWTGEITPESVKAKIFSDWGEERTLNESPMTVPQPTDNLADVDDEVDVPVHDPVDDEVDVPVHDPVDDEVDVPDWTLEVEQAKQATPGVDSTPAYDESTDEALTIETDALYANVMSDPVIAGLIESMKLTQKLSQPEDIRYVYAYYGSDEPMLVTELFQPLIAHVDRLEPTRSPLAIQAGVRRCATTAWIVDLTGSASRAADLSAIVWIPIGIARLGDAHNHFAWKLVPVTSGSTRTFHVRPEHAAETTARLEVVLSALYDDCVTEWNDSVMVFRIPSLGVTIELALDATGELANEDIHQDDDYLPGPVMETIYNIPLLADMARTWLGEQLGESVLEVNDWLPLLHMIETLIMRVEPVSSRDLLGQWATPDSSRGKTLIEQLKHIFADALSGDANGWVLSNVRCDVFWIEELLASDGALDDIKTALRNFVVNIFHPGYSQSLLSLGALDPRMRSTDGIQLEQIIKGVLDETLDLLSPDADGELLQHLDVIKAMLGGGD